MTAARTRAPRIAPAMSLAPEFVEPQPPARDWTADLEVIGRVDTAGPGRQLDLGGLIEFELTQRIRAYRLINEYCPETRVIASCYRACGEIKLFAYPWVALDEVRRMEAEEQAKRRGG